jgi:hypothetical protein
MFEDLAAYRHALSVEFALFRNDTLLCRGMIQVEDQQKSEEFDYTEPPETTGTASSGGHLAVRHQFGLPAASLEIWLIRYLAPEGTGEVILEAAMAMGVHDSEDWESLALREYTFAFRCREEVGPAHQ